MLPLSLLFIQALPDLYLRHSCFERKKWLYTYRWISSYYFPLFLFRSLDSIFFTQHSNDFSEPWGWGFDNWDVSTFLSSHCSQALRRGPHLWNVWVPAVCDLLNWDVRLSEKCGHAVPPHDPVTSAGTVFNQNGTLVPGLPNGAASTSGQTYIW